LEENIESRSRELRFFFEKAGPLRYSLDVGQGRGTEPGEIVAALEERDDRFSARVFPQNAPQRAEIVLNQVQSAERVGAVGIETGGYENQLRGETLEEILYIAAERIHVVLGGIPVRKRPVERRTLPFARPGFILAAGSGVVR